MSRKTSGNGAFEKIMAGLGDAIAFAQGDHTRGRVVRGTWPPSVTDEPTPDNAATDTEGR